MRHLLRILTVLLASLALVTAPIAHAQYTAGTITYEGGAPYTDAELNAVAGLQPAQMLATTSIGNAAQHLIDTGLFDDVQSTYTMQGKTLAIRFAIKPTPLPALLAVSLENFVWFTPEELQQGLHDRVPLFHGVAATAGNMPDLIQAALEQMLSAKGVTATVSHILTEPSSQHMLRVIDFKVDQPAVRVATINLGILSQSPEAIAASKVTMPRNGLDYNEGLTGFTIEDFLLSPARNNGYLTAKVTGLHREWTETSAVKGVTVSAKVTPGEPYKIAALHWEPTDLYTSAAFTRDATLHPGDGAQLHKLASTEALIIKAYHAQGYLDAYIDRAPQLDETAHTVVYSLKAIPGVQYRLRSVTAVGFSPDARREFDGAWRLKPGDDYDETYVQKFVQNNSALKNLARYAGGYQIVADSETHQVDLTMTFVPGPPN